MLEFKTVPIRRHAFKADDDGPGSFEGYGATFGNVDDGGDVILKGAFAEALPDFLTRGFVPVGHNWFDLPIATVADAKEDDEGLYFKADFHSTQAAQDARTVVAERLDRGKFVGLSIGYLVDYENDGVEWRDDGVRVIKKIKELAEISIVTIPMNREAQITQAKMTGRSFTDEAEAAHAAVQSFVERAKALAALRVKEGRVLSQANRDRLAKIRDASLLASQDLDTILAETDPEKGTKAARLVAARYRRLTSEAALFAAEYEEHD